MTMNRTIMYGVRQRLEAQGAPEAETAWWEHAIDQRLNAEERLRRLGAELRSKMERVEANLDSGYHINSLGELQGQGREYDQACSLRQAACEMESRAVHFLAKAGFNVGDLIEEAARI